MRLARLLAVARKEVIQIRRDPRSLGMAFVIPMLLLFLFGYALTLDVDNLKTIVYDQDRTTTSRDFLKGFAESGYFTVVATAKNFADVEWALDSGQAQVGLVIPRNFARSLDLGRQVPVQALLDGSDSNTATLAYLEGITGRPHRHVVHPLGPAPRRPHCLYHRCHDHRDQWYSDGVYSDVEFFFPTSGSLRELLEVALAAYP